MMRSGRIWNAPVGRPRRNVVEGSFPEGIREGAVMAAFATEILEDLQEPVLQDARVAVKGRVVVSPEQAIGGLAHDGIDWFGPI